MAFEDDDILIKRSSHPVTTTLLFVTCFSLIAGMYVTSQQLKRYVNPTTNGNLNQFQTTAVSFTAGERSDVIKSARAKAMQKIQTELSQQNLPFGAEQQAAVERYWNEDSAAPADRVE